MILIWASLLHSTRLFTLLGPIIIIFIWAVQNISVPSMRALASCLIAIHWTRKQTLSPVLVYLNEVNKHFCPKNMIHRFLPFKIEVQLCNNKQWPATRACYDPATVRMENSMQGDFLLLPNAYQKAAAIFSGDSRCFEDAVIGRRTRTQLWITHKAGTAHWRAFIFHIHSVSPSLSTPCTFATSCPHITWPEYACFAYSAHEVAEHVCFGVGWGGGGMLQHSANYC